MLVNYFRDHNGKTWKLHLVFDLPVAGQFRLHATAVSEHLGFRKRQAILQPRVFSLLSAGGVGFQPLGSSSQMMETTIKQREAHINHVKASFAWKDLE